MEIKSQNKKVVSMDRGAWWAAVHWVAESDTAKCSVVVVASEVCLSHSANATREVCLSLWPSPLIGL